VFGKHYTNTTPTLHPTLSLVLGGVLGGVLGECWAHTHPSTFPLYKGCPAKLGGVSVTSLATIRNFTGGEMAFLSGQAAFSLSPANIFS